MATENECQLYNECGFVKWRKDHPDLHVIPLPENGDCGKVEILCGRLNLNIPNINVEEYGPITRDEFNIALPDLPNNNGKPPRKLVGGGYR